MEWSQANRPFRLETPLGDDVLLLVSWEGEEAISSLFRYSVVAWSQQTDIQASALLFKDVSLSLRLPDGSDRKIYGIVSRFVRSGLSDTGYMAYWLEIVPPHWALTLDRSFDIFQNKTSREICDSLLQGTPYEWRLVRTLDPRPYCFRYRESRWNCVSRLIEQEGIWYRFNHKNGVAQLVLGDNTATAREAWGVNELVYQPNSVGSNYDAPFVNELGSEASAYTALTKIRTASEFLTSNNLLSETSGASSVFSPPGDLQWYDFDQQIAAQHSGINHSGGDTPSDASKIQPDTKTYSRIAQERSESESLIYSGQSGYVGLEVGAKATIRGASDRGFNGAVFIIGVRHNGSNGSYFSDDSIASYSNSFTAIPANVPYRPPLRAEWPRVGGSHVGTVTGPEGEEIYTDKHGRVQVVFKWDTENNISLQRSCWIRVAQSFAGQQFGMVFLPRIGHEVIVDFLDGNPDNPVITGSLYNDANMPPWPLPANKTQSGVRTKSTLRGGASNHNELRFEDKKGGEQVFLQAEMNLDVLVKNDETRMVKHDRLATVVNNDEKIVNEGYDYTTVEKGEQIINVLDNFRELNVAKDNRINVGGNEIIYIEGDREVNISGSQLHVMDGDESVNVGGRRDVSVVGNETLFVERGNCETTVQMGNISIKADLGKITIEAMQEIELKVGMSSIKISPTGITIKGVMVEAQGQAMTKVSAPMTDISGSGVLQLKGGITMIN